MFAGSSEIKFTATKPIDINDGETKSFDPSDPGTFIFDGEVPEDAYVKGGIVAYDEDFSKDWEKRPAWVDDAQKAMATKATEVALASGNPYAIAGAAVFEAGLIAWNIAAPGIDKDDPLGRVDFEYEIPACGPAMEDREVSFKGGGGRWSSWDYTLRYRIHRAGPQLTVNMDQVKACPYPVQVTVHAIDSSTGAPVAGQVLFDGIVVGDTNTAFTYQFPFTYSGAGGPVRGTVIAPHYLYCDFHINVLSRGAYK